jgi:protein-S-isoprenylcysteine O-methyltransferase Ste14
MDAERLYLYGLVLMGVWAVAMLPTLLAVTPPSGRHRRRGYGPDLSVQLAWVVMEAPAVFVFAAVFFRGEHADRLVPLIFLALWQLHYLQRTFLFPMLMRVGGGGTPLLFVALGFLFNCLNASLNAYAISHGWLRHEDSWLRDPRFLVGLLLFVGGYALSLHADALLRDLRGPGERGYKIPRGGFFRWVSCPNYLGEIAEWCGWALATWTYAGAAFALFTIANRLPRAVAHHRWYRAEFPDYPQERKALVPGIL